MNTSQTTTEIAMNEEGLLAEGELEAISGGGAASLLLRGAKALFSPVGVFVEIFFHAKPAY